MRADDKSNFVLTWLAVGFCALAGAFWLNLWGKPAGRTMIPPTPPEFTNTATVRLSASDLIRTDGDTSGFSCYACHDAKKEVVLHLDANGVAVLPEAHKDIVMRHGSKDRNDHCFICHNPKNLEQLRVREGQSFKIAEGNRLCGSCHGPTYRDWEAGVHGRTVGFWSAKLGATLRSDCTSCHDPHSPAFPPLKPGPAPNQPHSRTIPVQKENRTH